MNDIRIVLADDEKLLRTALATLLEMEGGIPVSYTHLRAHET